jgi:hypothetical protein
VEQVNVLCMKWGTKYPADYVNRLHRMVAKHLAIPFRFVCLTDDASGLNEGIERFPIPEMPVDVSGPERGWTKILTFSPELYDLQGQTLFLDLDLLVVDNIDALFTAAGEVLIIKDWLKRDGTGNSSVYRFEIGKHPDVLQEFIERWPEVKKDFRNEQEFISAVLLRKGALAYWPETWCRSFKRHCMHPFPKSLFKEPQVPAGAKIVVFHGHPHPDEAVRGESGKWYRFMRPATWIQDYWG